MSRHLVRLVVFLALAGAAFPIAAAAVGMLGITGTAAFSAAVAVLVLVVTIGLARYHGEPLANLGFRVHGRDALAALVAFATGSTLFAGVALALGHWGGGAWQLNSSAPVVTALTGLVFVFFLVAVEELLFRGYAFQQLRHLLGPSATIAVSAVLFGAYHLLGSGDWAMGAFFRWLMSALGGAVFGYALVRTGSIAVPLGLHWGGNWVQAALLGLGQAPGESRAVWVMPLSDASVRTLAAPDLLPHLPYLVALAVSLAVIRFLPEQPRVYSSAPWRPSRPPTR